MFVDAQICALWGGVEAGLIQRRRQRTISCWKRFSLFPFLRMLLVFFLFKLPCRFCLPWLSDNTQHVQSLWGWCNYLTLVERRVKQSNSWSEPGCRAGRWRLCLLGCNSSYLVLDVWCVMKYLVRAIYFYCALMERRVSMPFFCNRP